jgi:hypothetical protein
MTRRPCRSDRATNHPRIPSRAGKAEPGFKLRHIAPGRLEHERPLAGCRLVAVLALASGCLLGKHWHLQGRGRFLEHRFGEPSSGTICSTGEPGMFLAHKR